MTRKTSPLFARLLALFFVLISIAVWFVTNSSRAAPAQYADAQTTTPVAPGVYLISFHRVTDRGPINGQILTIDLNNPAISTNLISPGPVAAAAPVSQMVAQSGAVAAVNGDYFDIGYTSAPYGAAIANNELKKGPIWNWNEVAGVGQDGVGRLARMSLEGSITLPSGQFPLGGLNSHNVLQNGIGLFTTAWGAAPRNRATEGVPFVREVLVTNGSVAAISEAAGGGPIGPDSFVLLGLDDGARALANLKVGDPVSVRYRPQSDVPIPFNFALGGNAVLLRDGQAPNLDDAKSDPRTAVGFSADGRKMYLATVDGRSGLSRGMTMRELADLMRIVGADDALNLDGGGSSTMLARKAGDPAAMLTNRPSGGVERLVPNAIGIFAKPGSGKLAGLRVIPALGEGVQHVFPGLSRTLTAKGYDESYGPAASTNLTWQSLTPDLGTFEPNGVFRALRTGNAIIQAQAQGDNGTKTGDPQSIYVLDSLTRIVPSAPGLDFAPGGGPAPLVVTGYSNAGQAAPIETRDIGLAYDRAMLDIVAVDNRQLQITPKVDRGTTTVTLNVGGVSASMPINIGLSGVTLSEFEDLAGWTTSNWLSSSGIGPTEGVNGQGIQITYDFAKSTEPRVASVDVTPAIELPGQPIRIGAWVRGEGRGGQLVFALEAADGQPVDLYGPAVDWSGWQNVELDVPQRLAYPLRFKGIRYVENDPAKQYTGSIAYDGLVVKITPAP
jgi:exopolysaccharide biosynthesis protein